MSKQPDLLTINVGQIVDIDDGIVGTVVFNSVNDQWSPEFPKDEWGYMDEVGLFIEQVSGALIFHDAEYFSDGAGRIKIIG